MSEMKEYAVINPTVSPSHIVAWLSAESREAAQADLTRGIASGWYEKSCFLSPDEPRSWSPEDLPLEEGTFDHEPPIGSYAATARLLAEMGIMSGDEADEWKDRMKDEEMGL